MGFFQGDPCVHSEKPGSSFTERQQVDSISWERKLMHDPYPRTWPLENSFTKLRGQQHVPCFCKSFGGNSTFLAFVVDSKGKPSQHKGSRGVLGHLHSQAPVSKGNHPVRSMALREPLHEHANPEGSDGGKQNSAVRAGGTPARNSFDKSSHGRKPRPLPFESLSQHRGVAGLAESRHALQLDRLNTSLADW